jgi:hypothetical protein
MVSQLTRRVPTNVIRFGAAMILLSTWCFAPEAAAAGRPPEVLELVGIRVGMTVNETQAQLDQRKLQTRIDRAQFPNSSEPFVTVLVAHTPGQDSTKPREHMIIQFATPPNAARVVSVSRLMTYPLGQGPALEDLTRAMVERFGPPARKAGFGSSSVGLWLWGKAGTPVAPDQGNTCQAFLQNFAHQGGLSMGAFTTSIAPEKFVRPLRAGCSSGVYTTFSADSNGIRTTGLNSVAVDFEAADKAIRATATHAAELQSSAMKRERNAAKQVKPDI